MIKTICISDKVLLGKHENKIVSFVCETLFKHNFMIDCHKVVASNSNIDFVSQTENKDITFVFVEKNSEQLTKNIANVSSDIVIENLQAKNVVRERYTKLNIPLEKQTENEWKMPSKAKLVYNTQGVTQGYITPYNGGFIVVLPIEYYQSKKMFEEQVLPYLLDNQHGKTISATYKTFGISEQNIKTILIDLIKNKDKVSLSFFSTNMEVDIIIKSNEGNEMFEKYVEDVFEKMQKYIYAEEDISMVESAFNLLKLNDVTVAFAESVTGGNIAKCIVEANEGASEVLKESIVCYSNESKMKLLGVDESTLNNYSSVSAETTYEIATGLLELSGADIVVATTGYASYEREKTGLVFTAVGNKSEIHVYKNIFYGTREDIISAATKAAYFYLIKKLRKKDFHYEKTKM